MNQYIDPSELKEGDHLDVEEFGPITQEDLNKYSAASGDSNPIHLDPEVARSRGLDGTIVHGMFVMALMGRYWSRRFHPTLVKGFETRFTSISRPGDRFFVEGKVKKVELDGEGILTITIEIRARGQDRAVRANAFLVLQVPGQNS